MKEPRSYDQFCGIAKALDAVGQRWTLLLVRDLLLGPRRYGDLLAGLPALFVWGNCDWDRTRLARYAEQIGVRCLGAGGEVSVDGKKIWVLHGDDAALRQRVLSEQRCDYMLQGHTHVRLDERVGRVRVINPGALFRAAVKSVALLDTESDALRFLEIPIA